MVHTGKRKNSRRHQHSTKLRRFRYRVPNTDYRMFIKCAYCAYAMCLRHYMNMKIMVHIGEFVEEIELNSRDIDDV